MMITAVEFFKIRTVFRLSQTEYGDLLSISGAQVNRIERGNRSLTERVKQRLIDELELTPEKLARILSIYNEYKIS